jgi:hypothetical protein
VGGAVEARQIQRVHVREVASRDGLSRRSELTSICRDLGFGRIAASGSPFRKRQSA